MYYGWLSRWLRILNRKFWLWMRCWWECGFQRSLGKMSDVAKEGRTVLLSATTVCHSTFDHETLVIEGQPADARQRKKRWTSTFRVG